MLLSRWSFDTETSDLFYSENKLAGFSMIATVVSNECFC